MDAQQIFETVSRHLFNQGCMAEDPNDDGMCRYRAKDGNKCAVGVLIPDDAYDPTFEGKPVIWLVVEGALPKEFAPYVMLLNRLQAVHDSVSSWSTTAEMKSHLLWVAMDYPIDTAFLNDLKFAYR